MEKRVLVYNNETGIVQRMASMCRGENFKVLVAEDVEQLYDLLEHTEIHLLVVDVALDDKGWAEGLEMIVKLRQKSRIPLIVVSAQSAETAKIMALNSGADDYVTADCNPLVLLARMKSQLRRYTQMMENCEKTDRIYRAGGLTLDDRKKSVTIEGRNIHLTPVEYKILRLLVQQRGTVFSNSQIYESIWNMRAVGVNNTIAVHICHLREKIEEDPKQPKYLKVVWGNGYKIM